MKTEKIVENEHALSTPELVGTDEEKIVGIKFWADVIALLRTLNTTFISYNNKKSVIQAFKTELDLIESEIDNVSSKINQKTSEIPSAEQPSIADKNKPGTVNVVDLTKNSEVTAQTESKNPTFENLDKLRRVAGSGIWDKNHGPVYKKKK